MKQITEDYVSYETAVLLKEKWFNDEPTRYYRTNDEVIVDSRFIIDKEGLKKSKDFNERYIQCPTQSLALKWLREVHNIYIDILTYTTGKNIQFRWVGYDKGRLFSQEEGKTIYFNSYEEAVEAALKYTLENLI